MAFFCVGPCSHPFRDFNKYFAKGVPHEVRDSLKVPTDWDKVTFAETDVELGHYNEDWLGTNAWFGPESGQKLYRAFVYALQAAGDRPVSGVWVEGVSVRASIMDHGDALQVVVTSPRPHVENNEPHGPGPCATVFPLHGKHGLRPGR